MRALALALVLALLAGCGWHIRGAGTGGFDGARLAVANETGGGATLERAVRDALRNAGAELMATAATAEATVVLMDQGVRRRRLSGSGGITNYELVYSVRFRVEDPDGKLWAGPERVASSATYEVDDQNVLAGQRRRDELEGSLRGDVVRLLVARVQPSVAENRAR